MIDDLALDSLMNNQDFREIMMVIIQSSKSGFNENPYKNAYNAGRASIGGSIEQEMKRVNLKLFIKGIEEYVARNTDS